MGWPGVGGMWGISTTKAKIRESVLGWLGVGGQWGINTKAKHTLERVGKNRSIILNTKIQSIRHRLCVAICARRMFIMS